MHPEEAGAAPVQLHLSAVAKRLSPPVQRRLGLVLLSTDLTSELEFAQVFAATQTAVHVSRLHYCNPTTRENLLATLPELGRAVGLLPPVELDAIGFACTSASMLLGNEGVHQAMHAARADVPLLTPSQAAVMALRALGARQVALLLPYAHDVAVEATRYLSAAFAIESCHYLDMADDRDMAALSAECLIEAGCAAITPDSDALFISCTAVPTLSVIAPLEARLGRPVVSSNLAMIWAMAGASATQLAPLQQTHLGRIVPPAEVQSLPSSRA